MIRRFLPSSGAPLAKVSSSETVGSAALTAARPVSEALPRALKAGRETVANGPSRSKKVLRFGAASESVRSAGVCSSATRPSWYIAGRSCSRNPGRRLKPAAMSALRSALADDVRSAMTTQRATCLRLSARSPITVSAFLIRLARTWFCWPRMCRTLSVSCSPGEARLIASLRFWALPATAAPSSLTIRLKRSR